MTVLAKSVRLCIVGLALWGLVALGMAWAPQRTGAPDKVDVATRVLQSGTLHCGYAVWAPYMTEDPNTKKLGGVFYDYVEALGRALNLKILWTEEAWSAFIPDLQTGRIDAMCSYIWPNAARARAIDFVTPPFYTASRAYVRADDFRFDGKLESANAADVTLAVIDGEGSQAIAAADFPKAKTFQMTGLTGTGDLYEVLMTKKADMIFVEDASAAAYMSKNPGKIREVPTERPLRAYGDTIAVAQGQDRLRRMLDVATQEMINSGAIEKLLAPYETKTGVFLRPAASYR